jgi:hypothetical protein
MRRPYAITLFLLAVGLCLPAAPLRALELGDAIPVSESEAPLLFKQCSRDAPSPEGKVRLPSASEVAQLEAALVKHLSKIELGSRTTPAKSKRYHGQYVGFMRGGAKHIYASYTPAELNRGHRGRSLVVCDGGNSFWGIVYNPLSGQFSDLRVNGGW